MEKIRVEVMFCEMTENMYRFIHKPTKGNITLESMAKVF